MTSAGCKTSNTERLTVSLPPAPTICSAVAAPALKEGQDARAALARAYGALLAANGRLRECRAWIESVRQQFEVAK